MLTGLTANFNWKQLYPIISPIFLKMTTNVGSNNLDGDSGCSFGDGGNEELGNGKMEWKNGKLHSNSSILRIGINGMERQEADATFVDQCLSKMFHQIGIWIGQYPVPLVSVFLIISTIFSSSIPFTPQQDDLKNGYTPNGAQSRVELAKYEQHFRPDSPDNFTTIQQKTEPISLLVFIQAKDNGTLLRESHLLEMVQLIDQLFNDFPLAGHSFAEFCTDFCQFNEPIRQFTNGFLIRQRQLGHDDRVNLSFPFMSILGHQIDLSPHFFDTKLDTQGQLTYFRLALLQFKADPQANVSRMELIQWERRIVHFLHKEYKGFLRPLAFTMSFVADEVIRTGMTLFPFLSVGFGIMCLFSVVTVSFSAAYFRQFSSQKVFIALIACCCPLFACAAGLGLLFWMGLRFGTILCVSPFLVLAIGVDDAFLMLQSWQRICAEWESTKSKQTNDAEAALNEKIGQMLEDVGPSITITSATNVLAFCIGILTPTPEIQLFCTGTATAILFDYIFQIFLFTPCLAIVGKYEMQNEGRKGKGNDGCCAIRMHNFRIVFRQQLSAFMRAYCRWIANGFTCFFVSIFLIFYWIFSAKYAFGVVPNITPRKLLLADSVLNEVVTLKDKFILPNYMPVTIFVENVGDLRDKQRIDRIKSLIAEFESESNNLGPPFTHFWLRDYEQFLNNEFVEEQNGEEMIGIEGNESFIERNPFSRPQMASFLEWPEYRHWNGFLRFRDDLLDRFFVITAFHGPELIEWNNRAKLLARWRQIVAKYNDDLSAFIWVEEAQFLDQIETLIPATIQSSIATLVCMSFICFLFMSNIWTVILATISIVSICLGAFGLLVVWGIGLDPISMATTIMSIGFSVDFPAHIAYHYYRYGKNNNNGGVESCPEERVQAALISIGFPLIQCGMSTIFFVLCLLFVDTYMSEVFVKTMFLVVSLGLIHGLFIVPTMLCAITKINSLLESKKSTQNLTRRKNSIKNQKLEGKGSSKLVVSIAGPG